MANRNEARAAARRAVQLLLEHMQSDSAALDALIGELKIADPETFRADLVAEHARMQDKFYVRHPKEKPRRPPRPGPEIRVAKEG